jgi:aminoglycoside phosphotransferase (APT) family kinase protein
MKSAPIRRISRADLEPVLRTILVSQFGPRARLRTWWRRVSAYSSSSLITRIRLAVSGTGQELQLAFKDLTPGAQLPTARRVRPAFLYDPNREIATYQQILDPLNLGTARCFGANVAADPPHYWLFLEWARGPLLWQLGRMSHWQQAARWLAKFHHEVPRLPDLDRRLRSVRPLVYDRHSYATWIVRAESVLSATLLRKDRLAAQRFARIARRYDRVAEHLCRLPQTLVHGEFYPANIVMRRSRNAHLVCPIDWELTSWGPGVLDLAALCAGQWAPEEKRRILVAYREVARERSPGEPELAELTESVAHAHLHLCVRHLGWAARWRPQGQQARTWLADALTLSSQLGL